MNTASIIRQRIWGELESVAVPDSRFHLNFAEVIPDFAGSDAALDRLDTLAFMQTGRFAFITPDNCLVELRRRLLLRGVSMVVSSYGIHSGFYLLERDAVPPGHELYAAWLDGLAHFGRPVTLAQIAAHGRFDYMVTGASAVSRDGVRFGKGHGFFDLEWGMFTDRGLADERTPVAAVVHDVQLVDDELTPSPTDIIVDYVATPATLHAVRRQHPRPRGVQWELLDERVIAQTPPLQELQRVRGAPPPRA